MACKRGVAKEFKQLMKTTTQETSRTVRGKEFRASFEYYLAKAACVKAYVYCHLGCD